MNIIEDFAKIDAFLFKYKPEAQEKLPETTDDKEHVGVMAQQMLQTPTTKNVVEEDPESGYLQLDINSLVMTLTAAVSELSKKVIDLEGQIKTLRGE